MKTKPKSLRFSEAEQAEIRAFIELTGEQEAVVLERAAMRGLREERVERGLMAYLGGASSGEAAEVAGIGHVAFINKLLERGIKLLDDRPEDMLLDLSRPAEVFGDERLMAAIAKVSGQPTGTSR